MSSVSSGLAAIFLAIASPAQLIITSILGLLTGIRIAQINSATPTYVHLEIDEAYRRLEFCRQWYRVDHPERAKAEAKIEAIISDFAARKLLSKEDLQMYADLDYCGLLQSTHQPKESS